jgi:hypothetical protein
VSSIRHSACPPTSPRPPRRTREVQDPPRLAPSPRNHGREPLIRLRRTRADAAIRFPSELSGTPRGFAAVRSSRPIAPRSNIGPLMRQGCARGGREQIARRVLGSTALAAVLGPLRRHHEKGLPASQNGSPEGERCVTWRPSLAILLATARIVTPPYGRGKRTWRPRRRGLTGLRACTKPGWRDCDPVAA